MAIDRRGRLHGHVMDTARVLVLGDTPRDVEAAHAASAVAVGVATGKYTGDDLRAGGADYVPCDARRATAWYSGRTAWHERKRVTLRITEKTLMIPGPSEQVIVVTGASSGVGRAVARACGAWGAKVALVARNLDGLETAAEEIRQAGGDALALSADVADADAVERAAAATEQHWGRIDTWINAAMVSVLARVKDTTAAEYRRVTEVTYLGYVHGTLAALRRMLPRDEGTIVQVGSALAYRSIPLQSAYCAAKAAIRGFTDSLRSELIHDGSHVRLTHVHLPAVNTPQSERQRNKMPKQQQPVPPMFSPETIAEAILWAAEHAPREMVVGGPTLQALWGQRLIPGALDRYLAKAAWDPQFVDKPNDQQRDVLFETISGDPGAHGPYRDRERGPDLQLRLRMHPRGTSLLLGSLAAVSGFLWLTRRGPFIEV